MANPGAATPPNRSAAPTAKGGEPSPRGAPATAEVLVTAGGQPVAGAELRYSWSTPRTEAQRRAAAQLADLVWRTDSAGLAAVERAEVSALLTARAGSLYGTCSIDPDARESPFRIALARDLTLRVQVVDAAGRPVAGAPVRAGVRGGGRGPLDQVLGETEGGGALVVEHLQCRFGLWRLLLGAPPEAMTLSALASGADTAGIDVALDAVPPQPIVLRRPDVGCVAVRVVDHRGRSLRSPALVSLLAKPAGAAEPWPLRSPRMTPTRDGDRYAFDCVAAGSVVRVTAVCEGVTLGSAEGSGPRAAGEEVELLVRTAPDVTTVAGRVVDAEGAVLANERLALTLEAGERRQTYNARTDGEGAFACAVHGKWAGVVAQVTVGLGSSADGCEVAARAPPQPLRPGPNHLGELRLQQVPLLLSGRLVDETGAAVEGPVRLLVQRLADVGPAPQTRWSGTLPVHVAHAAGGAFAVRGFAREPQLAIDVHDPSRASIEPVRFTPGTTGLELVTPRAHHVQLRLRHDDAERLRGWVRAELACAQPRSPRPFRAAGVEAIARGDGGRELDISWYRLPPGDYDLSVWLRGDPQPLLVRRGIAAQADAALANEHRLEVDLGPLVRVLRIDVVDAQGQPIAAPAGSALAIEDAAAGRFDLPPHDGAFWLPCGASPRAFTVRVPGRGSQTVENVTADTSVRLQPPQLVELVLEAEPGAEVPPHLVLRAFLRHVDEPPRSPLAAADAAPGPGRGVEGERAGAAFRFALAARGAHRVGVLLEDQRTHCRAAVEATPSVVTLAAGAEGTAQRLSLRLPAASLQRALDELAR